MYAMCTGRPPFRAETSYGILRRITDTEPRPIREVNANIPEWLEYIIQRLPTKSLDDRIPTADHLATLLQKCLAHIQQPTIVELPDECSVPLRRREVWPNLSRPVRNAALIVVGSIAIAGIYSISRSMFGEGDPVADSKAVSVRQETTNSDGSSSSTATEWESIQKDIDAFDQELGPSEVDAGNLWPKTPEAKPL